MFKQYSNMRFYIDKLLKLKLNMWLKEFIKWKDRVGRAGAWA